MSKEDAIVRLMSYSSRRFDAGTGSLDGSLRREEFPMAFPMRTRRLKPGTGLSGIGEGFAHTITHFAGSSLAFVIALTTVVIWAALGPVFGFSDTWQLVINTSTTIVTFLMVFLIQRSQNKDSLAIELKLNEIVAALEGRATGSSTSRTCRRTN